MILEYKRLDLMAKWELIPLDASYLNVAQKPLRIREKSSFGF